MADPPTTRFEAARLEIAREHLGPGSPLQRALARAVRVSATTLEVARVGVWFFSADGHTLRADTTYDLAQDAYVAVAPLDMASYPAYAEALTSRRVIRVTDAATDPRTIALQDDYLRPAGIGALLDAPVFRGGDVVGVVCHEHRGARRDWTPRDVDFAMSVADMLGALLEQALRLEVETRAAQAARSAALGRLAAACAHDMGNVLSAISMTAESLALCPPLQDVRAGARAIVSSCGQGAALIRHLLTFARGEGSTPPAVLDLADLVRGVEALVHPLLQGRATLDLQIEPGAHLVLADRSQLEQVALNLIVNARDAIPPGRVGRIVVRVGPGPVSAGREEVQLAVEDDGVGMDAAVLARAFEPFFTTKPEGTGLGLAIVFGAVTRADGTVHIESVPGVGTTVVARLPRASGQLAGLAAARPG